MSNATQPTGGSPVTAGFDFDVVTDAPSIRSRPPEAAPAPQQAERGNPAEKGVSGRP